MIVLFSIGTLKITFGTSVETIFGRKKKFSNKLGNIRIASQFWRVRSVIASRI
jgi:hypothetical protein